LPFIYHKIYVATEVVINDCNDINNVNTNKSLLLEIVRIRSKLRIIFFFIY